MLDHRKHDFRLSLLDQSIFREALDRALAAGPSHIGEDCRAPRRFGSARHALLQLFEDDARPHFFDLLVHLPEGDFGPEQERGARELFDHLVAMDDAACALPSEYDEDEELAAIFFYPAQGEAVFSYFSNLWNTEWFVAFARTGEGVWECLGIPKPGELTG